MDTLRADVNGLKASMDRLLARLNPVYDTLDDEGNIIEEPDDGNFAMFGAQIARFGRLKSDGNFAIFGAQTARFGGLNFDRNFTTFSAGRARFRGLNFDRNFAIFGAV